MWSSWQRKHGRATDLKRFERLKELENKAQSEGLSPQEQKELKKERRYKERRDKAFVPSLTRLDAPVGEGATRTHQESISMEDYDFSQEQVRDAEFELEQLLDEDDFDLLKGLQPTTQTFLSTVEALKKYYNSGRREDKIAYYNAVGQLAKFYIYGPTDKKTERRCLTCKSELADGAKSCRIALKMQKDIFDAYHNAIDMAAFDKIVQKLDSPVQKHYELSGIRPFVDSLMFTGLEITEDEVDLSFEDDITGQATPKLNFNDFKARALAKLSQEQATHFNGTNVQTTPERSIQTEDILPEKIKEIGDKIDQLIRKVDEEDLLEELVMYLRA